MDEQESQRISNLLDSVEKEESRNEQIERTQNEVRKRLFDEVDRDEDVDGSGDLPQEEDDDEEDNVNVSEHNSESEQSTSGDEELVPSTTRTLPSRACPLLQYTGKDMKTKWNMYAAEYRRKTRKHNIVTHVPGPLREAKHISNPLEAWQLYFPDTLLDKIVDYTNLWITKRQENYVRIRDAAETNKTEVKAVIGLLYMAGVLKSSHANLNDLYSKDGTGVDIFRTTMSERRFKFLLTALRFDDHRTRPVRKQIDKFAGFREVFDEFVEKCKKYYSLSEYVTVDEMLDSFRGRCSFRQYIANKPAKYGLKIHALCDARTFYTGNLEVYTGKQPNGPFKVSNSSQDVVERIIKPISQTGRNVTMDNWYTSVPLANSLLANHKLTMVGTVRKNKREVPPVFVQAKERPVCSSMFGFGNVSTLLSYVPRKNKVVLLISTMHDDDAIDESSGEAYKPEMLTFYNLTKGGVDVVDKLKGAYSVSRISRRWTLTLFYSLLNIGGINSFILLQNKVDMNRRSFLKTLSRELCQDHLKYRQTLENLPRSIKQRLEELCGPKAVERKTKDPNTGRCYYCDRKKNRKTKTSCVSCFAPICREHTVFSCMECIQGRGQEVGTPEDEEM